MRFPVPGLFARCATVMMILFAPDLFAQTPLFSAPDTVCVGAAINVANIANGSTYFWNFCYGGFYNMPEGNNLGNLYGTLSTPVFSVTAKEGNNFYGFVSNNDGSVTKLNFGNSLLNTPTPVRWRPPVVPNHAEGLQLVQDASGWHLLLVGGAAETDPRIVRMDLGSSLASDAIPSGVNWGNIGDLSYPIDFYVFSDNGHYYGFTTNSLNNTITRFDFGTDFSNPPVGTNLGNLGGLDKPTGICAIQDGGNWYVYVTNETGGTITRLDFGASLLNTPNPTTLPNPGNLLAKPRDITVIHDCSGTFGLVVNGLTADIVRLHLDEGVAGPITGESLGDVGNLAFPHSISTMFREGANLYALVTNVDNSTMTTLVFKSCTESSIASSVARNPGSFSYSKPGTYTVNLLMDEAKPSQGTYCKNIVVLDPPVAPVAITKMICAGAQTTIDVTEPPENGITSYKWNNATEGPVLTAGKGLYAVTVGNGGCVATSDPFKIQEETIDPHTTTTNEACGDGEGKVVVAPDGGTAPYKIYWDNNLVTGSTVSNLSAGSYTLKVEDAIGCSNTSQITVSDDRSVCAPPVPPAFFTAPDTVCVNDPIQITQVSKQSTYYWNFCSGGFYSTPVVESLGNLGGKLTAPVFCVTAKEGNDYYGFVTNNDRHLERLYFGNSLLNTPTVTTYGNLNGALPNHTEGIQIAQDANGWHLLIVGGADESPSVIIRVDLGTSLAANTTPVTTNWGNVANFNYPTDLYVFKENNKWHGLVANFFNNTVSRVDFGSDFSTQPTGINFGSAGDLSNPAGVCAVQDNGNWYVFVTNQANNTLTRFDFGSSLLNTPVAVNIGNPGNTLNGPRDLTIIHDCGGIYGLVVNQNTSDIVKIKFDQGITGPVTGESYGNLGNLNFPHSVSSIFREGDDLYSFITNVNSGTMSRVVFKSCTAASIPNSAAAQPPSFSYNAPGVYTVNLLVDEALPTQNTVCKNIVVMDMPVIQPITQTVCPGVEIKLDATVPGTTNRYSWSTGATTPVITAGKGNYTVTVNNGGCTAHQAMDVSEYAPILLTATVQSPDCKHLSGSLDLHASGGVMDYEYFVDELGVAPVVPPLENLSPGTYTAHVTDSKGCVSDVVPYTIDPGVNPLITSAVATATTCPGGNDGSISVHLDQGAPPLMYSINGQAFQSSDTWNNLSPGSYQVVTQSDLCLDTLQVKVSAPPAISVRATTVDEACGNGKGLVQWAPAGGTPPYEVYWNSDLAVGTGIDNLKAGTYAIHIDDARNCPADTMVIIVNNTTDRVHILTRDTTINIGESVQLIAENNAPDFQWLPSTGLSCDICATTIATPLQPTTYILETLTGSNCITKDTVHIDLSYNEGLVVPNAFSPNGDGRNDIFIPMALGIADYHLSIFNRWGELIFESRSPKLGWDGTVKGRRCDVEAYVYMIQYSYFSTPGKQLLRRGTVTLVK